MVDPLVSIITPTYNHESYIGQCIQSVLSQSYENWEMLIVDDESMDGTLTIIQSFDDPRIRLFAEEHRGIEGLGDINNLALSVANGDLIAILEGDDMWPADKLKKQVPLFENPKVVLVWGGGEFIDENGNSIYRTPSACKHWNDEIIYNRPIGKALPALLLDQNFFYIPSCSIMIRRVSLNAIGGFWQPEGLYWVDRPTVMRLGLQGEFGYCDDVLGYWRLHSAQVTQTRVREVTKTSGESFLQSLTITKKKFLGLDIVGREYQGKIMWAKAKRALLKGQRGKSIMLFTRALFYRCSSVEIRLKSTMGIILAFLPTRIINLVLDNHLPLVSQVLQEKFTKSVTR